MIKLMLIECYPVIWEWFLNFRYWNIRYWFSPISEWKLMSISKLFRYWNERIYSDIFCSNIGIRDVNVGCQILPTWRLMSMPTYTYTCTYTGIYTYTYTYTHTSTYIYTYTYMKKKSLSCLFHFLVSGTGMEPYSEFGSGSGDQCCWSKSEF
jgi:hypothetical protein